MPSDGLFYPNTSSNAPGEKIGAIGQSLGGAAALLCPRPLQVDALVIEAVYPDIDGARELFARARDPKRIWEVRGAGHVDLERFSPEAYWTEVLPFLDAHLRPAP